MTTVDVDDFSEEKECIYKDDHYSARDNGAVRRHSREGKRTRAADDMWTFGKENADNPYLHIAGVQVHRIVATAFHGEPQDLHLVVDHIDTNCRNNRPENLRWLTRLENVLKNPITRSKVAYLCGSVEAFLDNPSLLRDASGNPNFEWMRAVTPEEAKNCKARMDVWAGSPPVQRDSTRASDRKPQDLSRFHRPLQKWEAGIDREPGLDFAMTPRSAQYMWSPSMHFPCCPVDVGTDPLDAYLRNTSAGAVFAYCEDSEVCPELTVERVERVKDGRALLVLCKQTGAGWSVVGIQLSRGKMPHFIHFNLGSYPSKEDAESAFAGGAASDFWSEAYRNG